MDVLSQRLVLVLTQQRPLVALRHALAFDVERLDVGQDAVGAVLRVLLVELLLVQLLDWASSKVSSRFDDSLVLDVADAVLELRGDHRVAAVGVDHVLRGPLGPSCPCIASEVRLVVALLVVEVRGLGRRDLALVAHRVLPLGAVDPLDPLVSTLPTLVPSVSVPLRSPT